MKSSPQGHKANVILFADEAPFHRPVRLWNLLQEITALITRHVVLEAEPTFCLALWVVHTYLFRQRDAVAYVAIESPEKRCGKTTLVSVLAELAHRPLVCSNITVGALFHAIDQYAPTLLLDEADTFLAGNGVMRGILNCGNTWRTAFVLRTTRGGKIEADQVGLKNDLVDALSLARNRQLKLVQYSCWCPKVIAMIGRCPETLADRSIRITMQRKLPEERCESLENLSGLNIRAKCLRYAMDNSVAVKEHARVRLGGINDRAADTFEPLAVLAHLAGSGWPQRLAESLEMLYEDHHEPAAVPSLLLDVFEILSEFEEGKLFTRDLVASLNAQFRQDGSAVERAGELRNTDLLLYLADYGIFPETVRIGTEVNKGIKFEELLDVLNRYVPRSAVQERIQAVSNKRRTLEERNALASAAALARRRQKTKKAGVK